MVDTANKFFEHDSHLDGKQIFQRESQKVSDFISTEELINSFSNVNIPDNPNSLEQYVDFLQTKVLPFVVDVTHPKFVGHMTSALPYFHKYISQLLVELNQNVVKTETSNVLTFLERQCIATLHKKFFQREQSFYNHFVQNSEYVLGSVTSNGSAANISALWAARNKGLETSKINCKEHGVMTCLEQHGYKDMVVIASELAHYSLEKFASLSGLGSSNILRIKTVNGKIDLQQLSATIETCRKNSIFVIAVVGVAGTTEIGSIDPLEELAYIAKKIWNTLPCRCCLGRPYHFL